MKQDIENIIKNTLDKSIKRSKYCDDCGGYIGYDKSTKLYYCQGCPLLSSDKTNQKSKSQLSTKQISLIADEVLKVVDVEKIRNDGILRGKQELYILLDECEKAGWSLSKFLTVYGQILTEKSNLSPNKENKNNER